jgi:copper chaperone CopZ
LHFTKVPLPEITKPKENTMNTLTLTLPAMYADHHVTRVRQTLMQLNGVENVTASSAFKTVLVSFDDKLTPEVIVDALARAGYAQGKVEVVERTPDHTSDPAWDVLAPRIVTTSKVDLQMSGEFRKY